MDHRNQWLRILKTAGLIKKIEGHKFNELHVHVLRKFFQTNCKLAGCRTDMVDYWLGHHPINQSEYLNDSYLRAPIGRHAEEYRKAVKSLTVYSDMAEAYVLAKEALSSIEQLKDKIVGTETKYSELMKEVETSRKMNKWLIEQILENDPKIQSRFIKKSGDVKNMKDEEIVRLRDQIFALIKSNRLKKNLKS